MTLDNVLCSINGILFSGKNECADYDKITKENDPFGYMKKYFNKIKDEGRE
jgi:hypothetical protein